MSDLIAEQFTRLLDGLDAADPWPALEASGFLDLLRPETEGGGGLDLEGLFPLALETGRRPLTPPVVETMAARLLAPAAPGTSDLEAALRSAGGEAETARALAAAVTAARMAGAMERIQEITLDWASTRKQFGREIGKFQAIQHQIAVLAEEAMAARMAAQLALTGPPLAISPLRAALAKMRAGEAAQTVAAIAHAVHGAIGVSQEHPLHHYTGALHRWRLAHGGESWWARRLGRWALTSAEDMVSLARTV
jgi:acyl-CoA dehydrogenase